MSYRNLFRISIIITLINFPIWVYANSGSWQKIGGPADKIFVGLGGIFATNPNTGDIWRYTGTPLKWVKIGEPGKMFAVGQTLYSISIDGKGVYKWSGTPMKWDKIGGPASQIYASYFNSGGASSCDKVYATNPNSGDIYEYSGTPFKWAKVGGPAKMFAAGCSGLLLWGISPDGKEVYEGSGMPMKWIKIGGPASAIFTGGCNLFATNPSTGDLYQYLGKYLGSPNFWKKRGGPGKMFAIDEQGEPYGLSPNGMSVWRLKPGFKEWEKIGGPAESIYSGYGKHELITKDITTSEVYQWILSSSPSPQPTPPPPVTKTSIIYGFKNIPYQGNIYYLANIKIANATLISIKNPDLGLGKQWTVMLIKGGASSADCGKSGKTIDLKPGASTNGMQGTPLNNWTIGFCLSTNDPYTSTQGLPNSWGIEITYKP